MTKNFFLAAITSVFFLFTVCPAIADQHNPERIMLKAAKQAIDTGKAHLVLDTRTKAGLEAENRKIPGSILIATKADLNKAIIGVSKNVLIITYCT